MVCTVRIIVVVCILYVEILDMKHGFGIYFLKRDLEFSDKIME